MALRLPEVTRCCFCFRLRTGALTIGYVAAIFTLLNIAANILLIVLVSQAVNNPSAGPLRPRGPDIDRSTAKHIYVTIGTQLFVDTVLLVVTIFLIIGVHKKVPSYISYFLWLGAANLLINLFLIPVKATFSGFLVTFGQILVCGVEFYFLLVVRSARNEMLLDLKPPTDVEMEYRGASNPAAVSAEQAEPLVPDRGHI